jgi:hypothetical protein
MYLHVAGAPAVYAHPSTNTLLCSHPHCSALLCYMHTPPMLCFTLLYAHPSHALLYSAICTPLQCSALRCYMHTPCNALLYSAICTPLQCSALLCYMHTPPMLCFTLLYAHPSNALLCSVRIVTALIHSTRILTASLPTALCACMIVASVCHYSCLDKSRS